MSVDDVQRGTLYFEHSILALSIASGPPVASLPQKLGYTQSSQCGQMIEKMERETGSEPAGILLILSGTSMRRPVSVNSFV